MATQSRIIEAITEIPDRGDPARIEEVPEHGSEETGCIVYLRCSEQLEDSVLDQAVLLIPRGRAAV
jgi:hypothetical protein